jgi:hypothetical protein
MTTKTRSALVCLLLATGCTTPPAAGAASARRDRSAPSAKLPVIPEPDRRVDGFPVWLGKDGTLDRVIVLVEGFDLYNAMEAPDLLRLVAPAADRLLAAGMDLLVVDFPDSHLAPDELAPLLTRAVRAASDATGGKKVAVVGLSGGGIVARWALVSAETAGAPLPVETLVLFDTPNRGARLHPALQALVLRYGERQDREAISCGSAYALIGQIPSEVNWRVIGVPFPNARRRVPAHCTPDSSKSTAFFERLWALNDHRGYPKQCRVVAVAQGSRVSKRKTGDLYRMWLPGGQDWTLKMGEADCAPGSLLPLLMSSRFRIKMPLGIAGAYLRSIPTFMPTESALDSGPGEPPPFDAWYARPDNAPPIAHDGVDPGAVDFITGVLLGAGSERGQVAAK